MSLLQASQFKIAHRGTVPSQGWWPAQQAAFSVMVRWPKGRRVFLGGSKWDVGQCVTGRKQG